MRTSLPVSLRLAEVFEFLTRDPQRMLETRGLPFFQMLSDSDHTPGWIRLVTVFIVFLAISATGGEGLSQVFFPRVDPLTQIAIRYDLSQNTQLELVDGITRTRLAQVEDYIREKQWEDLISILTGPIEVEDRRLFPVSPARLLPVAEYCRIRLGQLPPEALKIYRERIDPLAVELFEEAKRHQLPELYRRVVERTFASSVCGRALLALGDLAIERGLYATARAYWQMALPIDPDLPKEWLLWPANPDSTIDPALVRARLVLASILEGDLPRAEAEWNAFAELHPQAVGHFGGEVQPLVPLLGRLLAEAKQQSAMPDPFVLASRTDWPTVAGSQDRFRVISGELFPLGLAWQVPLPGSRPRTPLAAITSARSFRAAGNAGRDPLVFHPVVAGQNLFLATAQEVFAWNLATGEPAWPGGPLIYRDPATEELGLLDSSVSFLGIPQYTITVFGNRLFGRMGSPVTVRPPGDQGASLTPSALICLDLETQGRLLWRQTPPEKNMVFEGSPVSDGDRVFTVLRRNEIQTQIWVAAYEAATGRLLWKHLICIGEPLGRLTLPEASHTLLTLAEETLFVSTNLGAIAALDTDGRVRWVVTYPRERRVDLGDLAPHWFRQPNYAVFHRGILYAAPADTPKILAIDAMSGQLLWYTGDETASASFLLGVHGDRLIAGGGRLFWIGTSGEDRGRVLACWPEGSETPGYGRGVIVGQTVLWPGRDRLFMFDAQTARPIKVIPLVPWEAEGGNLLVARGHLVIAGSQKLSVFRLQTASPQLSWPEVTGKLPNPLRLARHSAFPFVTVP